MLLVAARLALAVWRRPERPTRVALAVAGVFVAMIGLPSVAAWVTHRSSPDLLRQWLGSADASTTVSVYEVGSGHVVHVPLNTYIVDVMAAELPPTAPMSALEATAVASRTYVTYLMANQGKGAPTLASRHHALVTDDGLLDLPWLTQAQQAVQFGSNAAAYTARMQEAVIATDGEVLTYRGAPIPAFMFALSPGRTRSASAVFGRSLPFLPATSCPADPADPADSQTLRFTPAELVAHLHLGNSAGRAAGGAGGSGASHATAANGKSAGSAARTKPAGSKSAGSSPGRSQAHQQVASVHPAALHVLSRGNDGFVNTVGMSGSSQVWTGTDFANLLGLPSADFTLHAQGGDLVVDTRGIGTDIGMSLHEAAVMASHGERWQQILSHFYPGTKLTPDTTYVTGN